MRRRIVAISCPLVLALFTLGIVLSFLGVDRYRGGVQDALSRAIGRQVWIDGDVGFGLISGPGFKATDVRIEEQPGGSVEPFAYVDELIASPRIGSLLTGHLQFSSITLDGAHLNVARRDNPGKQSWNFASVMTPALLAAFPVIHVRDSRINFKLDGSKSPFYLLNVDLDIAPQSSKRSGWDLTFKGEPARTDRPAHGFGTLEARGRWVGGDVAGYLELDAQLMRSEIGDVVSLVYGHDAGVHGIVSGKVHVAGKPSSLGVEGELRLSELHGWAQSPPGGRAFSFRISGNADIPGQQLELFAEPNTSPAPVRLHLAGSQLLQHDSWNLSCVAEGLALGDVAGLLRNFGAEVPGGGSLKGTLNGELAFTTATGWHGTAFLRDAALDQAGGTEMRFADATVSVGNNVASLSATDMLAGDVAVGQVSAAYSLADGSREVDLTSNGGSVPAILALFAGTPVPLFSHLQTGSWTGNVSVRQTAAVPSWSANGSLSDADLQLPELAAPLHITSARVRIEGTSIQMDHMSLETAGLRGSGDYRFVPAATYPHQFHLALAPSNAADLEDLLKPVLGRKNSIIDLALSLGREEPPSWLSGLHASGSVEARSVDLTGIAFKQVRSHVIWDGVNVVLPDLTARSGEATVRSRLNVDISQSSPRYVLNAEVTDLVWQGASVSGTVRARTSGLGNSLLEHLRVSGDFTAQDFQLPHLGDLNRAEGEYEANWSGPSASLRFPQLQIVNASGDTWTGTGEPGTNPGEVVLRLSDHERRINIAGSITNPHPNWVEQ